MEISLEAEETFTGIFQAFYLFAVVEIEPQGGCSTTELDPQPLLLFVLRQGLGTLLRLLPGSWRTLHGSFSPKLSLLQSSLFLLPQSSQSLSPTSSTQGIPGIFLGSSCTMQSLKIINWVVHKHQVV